MNTPRVDVVGGGLAGSEAAFQLALRGVPVRLREMRPGRMTGAHLTGGLAELVCSNSLGSDVMATAGGLLKAELRELDSMVLGAAADCRVPAGSALAVDRERLSARVEAALDGLEHVQLARETVRELPPTTDGPAILATGPLTAAPRACSLAAITGDEHLYFHDAIAPIVAAESLHMDELYRASRREPDSPGAYLNIPLDGAQYEAFVDGLLAADRVSPHPFEDEKLFEGCQPIESIARRGRESLRFGPMRPVGLDDPRTGRWPHAVIQLRAENADETAWGLVGFQTRLRHGEQTALLRTLPALAHAEFLRLGSIHRNTYLDAPRCLDGELRLNGLPAVRVAGQLAGCEGYVESTALGLMAGLWAAVEVLGAATLPPPPPETMLGALLAYLREGPPKGPLAPMNANFGLLPPMPHRGRKLPKRERRRRLAERALASMQDYAERVRAVLDH